MAFRDGWSFDDTTTILHRWTSSLSGSVSSAAARTGGAGLRTTGGNTGPTKTFDPQGTWIVGSAFRTSAPSVSDGAICTRDGSTMQGSWRTNTEGTITIRRGVTVVATSSLQITANVYYYTEFKHVIANSGGTLEVKINGAVYVTFTGDTQESANATADSIRLRTDEIGGGNLDYDDIYVCDGSGSAPWNDYLGEQAVYYLPCNADGDNEEWSPSAGSNFQNVDESPPDDDTTYNSTDVENEIDLFNVADLPIGSGTIYGAVIVMRARKETAGTANIQRAFKRAGTTVLGASFNPSTTYETREEAIVNDPVSTTQLTISNINDMQLGYKAVA